MKIKLLSETAKMPKRADKGAAGFDLYIPKDVVINTGRNVVPLDFSIALFSGYESHIRPRSGFSVKGIEGKDGKRYDADVIEGTVDESYRGNVGVIIKSYEKEPFTIAFGTRIAQMVIEQYYMGTLEEVNELDKTERGEGGFGHTGSK